MTALKSNKDLSSEQLFRGRSASKRCCDLRGDRKTLQVRNDATNVFSKKLNLKLRESMEESKRFKSESLRTRSLFQTETNLTLNGRI